MFNSFDNCYSVLTLLKCLPQLSWNECKIGDKFWWMLNSKIELSRSFAFCWNISDCWTVLAISWKTSECWTVLTICWNHLHDCWNCRRDCWKLKILLKAIEDCSKAIAKRCITCLNGFIGSISNLRFYHKCSSLKNRWWYSNHIVV